MPKSDLEEAAVRIEWLMPKALQHLFGAADDPLAGLPISQVRLLRAVADGPVTHSRLVRLLGLSPGGVSQVVRKSAEAGLVEELNDPEDRRVKHVRLTARGHDLLRERSIMRSHAAVEVLSLLPPAVVAQLQNALEQIVASDAASTPRYEKV